jgi:hypothetical protein
MTRALSEAKYLVKAVFAGRRAIGRYRVCLCSNPPSRTSTIPGLTWGYMESAAGPESPWWHQGGTDSVRRPWHGMD